MKLRLRFVRLSSTILLSGAVMVSSGASPASASLTFTNKTTANGLGGNAVRSLFVDNQKVYVGASGLNISIDGGQTFVRRTTADGLASNTIDGIWASGSTIHVATSNGLSTSTNGGQTFTTNNFGGANNDQVTYSVSAVGQKLYVGTFTGLRISADGGQTFTLLNSSTFGGGSGDAFISDVMAVGSTVFVAAYYLNSMSAQGKIFKSTDGGATFSATGAPSGDWTGIFVDGSNIYAKNSQNQIYLSTNSGAQFAQLSINGVHVSSDGGQNFVHYTTAEGLGSNMVYGGITSNGSMVFVGTQGGLSIGLPPAPTISSVIPTSGPVAGGTAITITGTNFSSGSTVSVGGSACTNVTVVSSTSITCTTPAGTAGSASVVVTSSGQPNSSNTLFTYIALSTTTSTVASTTTVPLAGNTTAPTLVTSANQAALTAAPGKASALVNGVAVSPQIVTASNSTAAQTDPAERTPEQVRELQQTATTIETRLDTIAGGDSGVSVVRTETGAVLTGIFTGTRVPVEDVVVVNAADTATLFAARDVRGNIVEVKPGAVLEVASNGDVAVQAFGLRTGETVELVVMSTPTLLGTFTVDAKGSIKTTAKLPNTIGSGNHSLVVASPTVKASLGLRMVKSSAALPVTGTADDLGNWAVAVLLSGVYIMMVSRSRRRIL
jgi:hypothetical protein